MGSRETQFWSDEFVWPITTNQLANLQFSWLSWLMVDHKCIRWWILKCPLRNLINWWDSLLERLLRIPNQTRVSKANHPQTIEENLINITWRDHWHLYMMFITILESIHGCAFWSWGSQTLDMDLMNQWDHALPTKELGKYKDIFLVFWLVKMIKYKYDIITKCLVISPKTNPMKEG